jgi:hypothetical protein
MVVWGGGGGDGSGVCRSGERRGVECRVAECDVVFGV